MEELKKSVAAVKREIDDELTKINSVASKLDKNLEHIDDIREEQKHVFLAHKQELDSMEECVKYCQIQIAQHDVRLKVYEANSIRQNGTLDKLDSNISEVVHGVNEIAKKVDAMDMSIANRINSVERSVIQRETDKALEDAAVRAKMRENKNKRDNAVDARFDEMRVAFLKDRIAFNWKIITAISMIAFFFLIVSVTILTHTFGGLPTLP